MISSGSNYEIAKETALRSDAHIITDLKTRWKFIEIDRREGNVDDSGWEPFAKSIQQAKLETLNTTSLDFALRLRKEDRLKGMRAFLHKVWNQSSAEDFSPRKTEDFVTEFTSEADIARDEWQSINQDLLKYATSESLIMGAATAIEQANWSWYGLGYAGVLGATLIHTVMRKESVRKRYPASLFVGA
jgi:hypothetical protein